MVKKKFAVMIGIAIAGIFYFGIWAVATNAGEDVEQTVIQKGNNRLKLKKHKQPDGTIIVEELEYIGDPQKKSTGNINFLGLRYNGGTPDNVSDDYTVGIIRITNDAMVYTKDPATDNSECVWYFYDQQWWKVCE